MGMPAIHPYGGPQNSLRHFRGPRCWCTMTRKLDEKIALMALIAFAAWLFVGLPLLYLPSHMIDWGTVPQWLTAANVGGGPCPPPCSLSPHQQTTPKPAPPHFFLSTPSPSPTP